jgi:hypothetical protein
VSKLKSNEREVNSDYFEAGFDVLVTY